MGNLTRGCAEQCKREELTTYVFAQKTRARARGAPPAEHVSNHNHFHSDRVRDSQYLNSLSTGLVIHSKISSWLADGWRVWVYLAGSSWAFSAGSFHSCLRLAHKPGPCRFSRSRPSTVAAVTANTPARAAALNVNDGVRLEMQHIQTFTCSRTSSRLRHVVRYDVVQANVTVDGHDHTERQV